MYVSVICVVLKQLNGSSWFLSRHCKSGALHNGNVYLFVCSFVNLSHEMCIGLAVTATKGVTDVFSCMKNVFP